MHVTINYIIEEIAGITNGKVIQRADTLPPTHLLLDSRKLIFPVSTIFFALQSSHKNANKFIKDLYKKGVRNFVVAGSIDLYELENANFILVDDTLDSLQSLAIGHRKKFAIPVIGITGSNGKTIVKEWLNQLLEKDFNIVRSPKSYNSQIGVPISVLQMNRENTLAIFEAGISRLDEMEKIEKIIEPVTGVFTNIGDAHSEGFQNQQQKINEKLKLFANAKSLVYCSDYKELNEQVVSFKQDINPDLQLINWSKIEQAFLKISSIEKENNVAKISADNNGRIISITIPFTDDASIENAINCWCVLLHMNLSDEIISERMQQLFAIEMRLQLKQGINNCSIINDSYSADINSLSIALDFLQHQKQHIKHTVILSDILQTGRSSKELYSEIAQLLQHKNISRLIGIGPQITLQQELFAGLNERVFFNSVEEFKQEYHSIHFSNETILLKGARVFEFEQIDRLLEQKVHQTILSIDLNAIAHNLKEYRQLLDPSTKLMTMVKAFSYGNGSYEIANLLQFNKVDYLAVAYADEGVELRKAGITLPIMVMNPEQSTFNSLVTYDLEPEIFSFSILNSLEKYLQSSAINHFPIHIKLDTGMHRLGFEPPEISSLANHLHDNNKIKVQSVFSHLVASEDKTEDDFTNEQANIFLQCCNELQQKLAYDFIRHIANTSGISRHLKLQLDMVRLGIGLYGIDHDPSMNLKLKNVTTLITTVAQIKNVKAGETVGYGRNAMLTEDKLIATVRIGYADGYPRILSNGRGKMLVQNKLAPIVGNVCMDMTMLDVSGIENLKEGDQVTVFGKTPSIQALAHWSGTIPYEIMTGVSQRVKRIYFEE